MTSKSSVFSMVAAAITSVALHTIASAAVSSAPFSISGQGISASGTLSLSQINISGYGAAWKVEGVVGTFQDSVSGVVGTFSGVRPAIMDYTTLPRPHDFPKPGDPSNHGSITSTFQYDISYDNIIYPGGDSPNVCPNWYSYGGGSLDLFGLLMTVNTTGGGTALVNVWSNGNLNNAANPIGVDYGIAVGNYAPGAAKEFQGLRYTGDGNLYETAPGSYAGSGISFAIVPEPSAVQLGLLGGLALLGLGIRSRIGR